MKRGKKSSFFKWIIAGLLLLLFVFIIYKSITGRIIASDCIDSDGGKNYYANGTANSGINSFVDSCVDSTYYNLIEAYCLSNGTIAKIGYPCQYGCKDGACNLENTSTNISTDTAIPSTTTSGTNPEIIDTGYGINLTLDQLENLQNMNNGSLIAQEVIATTDSRTIISSQQDLINNLGIELNNTLDSYGLPRALQEQLNEINAKAITWSANYNPIFLKSVDYKTGILGLKNFSEENITSDSESSIQKSLILEKSGSSLPASFDWRNVGGENYISSIKDQRSCGSCWAFASVAALEGSINAYYNTPVNTDLSEQELVSCFTHSTHGCNGGWPGGVFSDYFINHGISEETCFSYTATDNSCTNRCSDWQLGAWKTSGYVDVVPLFRYLTGGEEREHSTREAIKFALINYGPITTGMEVYEDFFSYYQGIYQHTWGDLEGNHLVTIVGYGSYDGIDYWIVKNSWGSWWGEDGYFKIAMGNSRIDTWFAFAVLQPISPNLQQKLCTDVDNDNYCYWGLETKPQTGCPESCNANSVEDCDDSNFAIFQGCGAIDSGTLSVTSAPSAANVYVLDQNSRKFIIHGVTPLTLNLNPGTRTIKVEKYSLSALRRVTISSGQTQVLNLSLGCLPSGDGCVSNSDCCSGLTCQTILSKTLIGPSKRCLTPPAPVPTCKPSGYYAGWFGWKLCCSYRVNFWGRCV